MRVSRIVYRYYVASAEFGDYVAGVAQTYKEAKQKVKRWRKFFKLISKKVIYFISCIPCDINGREGNGVIL